MKKKKHFIGKFSLSGLRNIAIITLAALIIFGTAACVNDSADEPVRALGGSVSIPSPILLGDTVEADTSNLYGTGTISYQWQIRDSVTEFTDIEGATGSSFVVQGDDVKVGSYLRVTVTRTDRVGSVNSNVVEISVRAFIDFSGYTGPPILTTHQPPEGSGYTGQFTLENGITGNGLRISHRGDGADVEIRQHGGEMAANSDDFLYFFIDNEEIRSADIVTIEVTFFDNSTGNFNLQYVRHGDDFYSQSFPKSNTQTFVTVKVELDNCNFTQGHNQGAQFRFNRNAIIQKAAIVTGGISDPLFDPPPPFAPSTILNNMIGKGVTGYQAWFKAPGDGWHHWRGGSGGRPGPGNVNVELWPAGWEDYLANGAVLHDTSFTMPNGSTARLFNSHDAAIIRTHLKWMNDAGIDGAAVQRFFEETSPIDTGNAPSHLTRIRDAAQEYGRLFYIMYDMSAAGTRRYPDQDAVIQRIQLDWIYNVENKGLVSSPNYAQAEGKPVVCIWGVHAIEDTDDRRYITVDAAIELIFWFRSRGYYVIGGIPDDVFWRDTEDDDRRHPRGREMYSLFDMISPWYIGRDVNGQILGGQQRLANGMNFCRDNPRSWAGNKPIDFMPTIWPGFAWTNMPGNSGTPNATPRNAGQWIWTQVREYLNRDVDNVIQSIYLAMFDEYDEATNWMKAASDFFDIPLNQYFLTHASDGIWLSSDYYMRIARAAVQALKGKISGGGNIGTLNAYNDSNSVIVEHSLGPVYWRNSFERRNGRLKHGAGEGQSGVISVPVSHLQVDVGIPNGGVTGAAQNVTVTGTFTVNRPTVRNNAESIGWEPPSTTLGMIYTDNARSGESAFRLAGTRTAGSGASYLYRIADTRIKAENGMSLNFWQRTENSLGANVIVDLLLDNGVYLSSVPGYSLQNDGAPQGGWQRKTVSIPASQQDRYITAVIIAYRDNGTQTGSFAALIDDIIIDR